MDTSACRKIIGGTLAVLTALSACAPAPTATPTPSPTATVALVPADNANVEALTAAQAALTELQYGLAPLLVEDDSRLVIENGPAGEQIRLTYRPQPADPTAWRGGTDSFVLAYAASSILSASPQVRRVALGKLDVAAPVDGLEDRFNHYAVWVRFNDGSEAIVDLTPLATNFAPRHIAREYLTDATAIQNQFDVWRAGVPLNLLQPMAVVTDNNDLYHLVAKALVWPDRYEFSLRAYFVQTATPMRQLQLTRGAMANLEVNRADFKSVQQLLLAAGPTVFYDRPELLRRAGGNNAASQRALDEHLPLLWHMVTKLEHRAASAAGTPVPTPTPTPSPTPTPTPTPTRIPLLTS
ncbi:MAG: hypothetical protein AB1801_19530 [Chloroflexota bacterium]